ncbi:hypothetical protein CLAIMM_05278, partial [Cladophialophora immunda]
RARKGNLQPIYPSIYQSINLEPSRSLGPWDPFVERVSAGRAYWAKLATNASLILISVGLSRTIHNEACSTPDNHEWLIDRYLCIMCSFSPVSNTSPGSCADAAVCMHLLLPHQETKDRDERREVCGGEGLETAIDAARLSLRIRRESDLEALQLLAVACSVREVISHTHTHVHLVLFVPHGQR